MTKLPPHFNIILPPLAAQLLDHFTPSERNTPSFLHNFTLLGSPFLDHFTPSEQITFRSYTFLPAWADQLFPHFVPSVQKYLLRLAPIYPPPPLEALLLSHFTPSEQITSHSYTI